MCRRDAVRRLSGTLDPTRSRRAVSTDGSGNAGDGTSMHATNAVAQSTSSAIDEHGPGANQVTFTKPNHWLNGGSNYNDSD